MKTASVKTESITLAEGHIERLSAAIDAIIELEGTVHEHGLPPEYERALERMRLDRSRYQVAIQIRSPHPHAKGMK